MTDISTVTRKPHVVLDLKSRFLKAKKIEALIDVPLVARELKLLEIGTGSGGIASYFSGAAKSSYRVSAVDVVDNRLVTDGYDFQLVDSVYLPFDDEVFDVVITNHVIEHVGLHEEQSNHLKEVGRVLKKNGVAYLAVPNRWMLIEPHYGLIFLSWLPRRFRTPYLRLMGKGSFYDCEPLGKNKLESLLDSVGLRYENKCLQALFLTYEFERPLSFVPKIISFIPQVVLKNLIPLIPTHIYILKKK